MLPKEIVCILQEQARYRSGILKLELFIMRIGIDVQPLQTGTRYAGVGCYLRNILRHLSDIDTENEYILFLNNSDYLEEVKPPSPTWKKYYVTRKHRLGRFWWCWDTLHLSTVLSRKKIDIYHYNSLSEFEKMAPPFPFGKHRVVATIHDLIPLKFPNQSSEYFSSSRWSFDYSSKLRRLQYTDAIITVSNHSKQDINELLNYPEERIFVAYNGISDGFVHEPDQEQLEQFKKKYPLPEFFILYLGGYYSKRKNLERLFEAYKILRHNNFSPQPSLVLAGLSNPVHKKRIGFLLDEKKLSQYTIYLPYIPDEELPLLYRLAALFVYPSLYEGFGLPVAEAMACGTMVATSNCSSLPEVVGEAGLYFDPYDTHAIAETMYEGLTNMPRRKVLQQKGQKRATLFSWEQAARTVLSIYKQICPS
jgi:glycosyltransferase involved in cell wall biosynthesis